MPDASTSAGMSPGLLKVVGRESPRVTSTEEPDGGNLLVRIWRGAGVGNPPAYSTSHFSREPTRPRPPTPCHPAPAGARARGRPALPPWHTPGQGVARSAPRQRRARAGGHRPTRRRGKQGRHHHRRWGCCHAFVAWELLVMRASFPKTAFTEAFPPWPPTALPHPAQPVRG